ncbi:MAG: imidazoleglycerol-phosphate dehydratase HisB [Tepidanaerobacteraceae bacterium]|jgi:imidazoleglycerol-phosphate dehydratase|nr:imidazoleglycerol-phosphate dehydratase HisB [Tepidanaerobacter sp.]HQA59659.1 imidazoleglycerol-phosphate dehydratase HisB [Tepidanaerobacteraceae bacterium]HQE05167.1 imidazoleglycerol-phosphate dehydratase HisB [Tepidanaerobacteraceae bacterium]
MARTAEVYRKTGETEIKVKMNLDGQGENKITTQVFFLNHMLDLFSRHGLFDLEVDGKGDIEVDFHHLVEDVGIVLGQAFLKALGNKEGIKRYGTFYVPMDEALAFCSVDISGRPYIYFDAEFSRDKVGEFDVELVKEFFVAFANNARITIHLEVVRGENTHHMIEALFKAFGRALREAVAFDPREKGVPSTKGVL